MIDRTEEFELGPSREIPEDPAVFSRMRRPETRAVHLKLQVVHLSRSVHALPFAEHVK